MLDFSSTHYLGFRHASRSLRPWSNLTTGAPTALVRPPGAAATAGRLASLQGCEAALLAPSTLHLFWDLLGLLARQRRIVIYLDAGTYPIARWGVERAAARGVPVHNFPHNDAEALRRMLASDTSGRRPVVVTDGLCTICGCALPLAVYLDCVRQAGGLLVIDDTQALGVLGGRPGASPPYGQGGGGSLRFSGSTGPEVVVVSSLAKGFGVPVAALAGSLEMTRQFKAGSETRVHCSPPSAAAIHAAEHALDQNAAQGEAARAGLAQRVKQFRRRLSEAGLVVQGGLFPIQTLILPAQVGASSLYQRLIRRGIRAVLRRGHGGTSQLSFILTARHRQEEIDRAVMMILRTLPEKRLARAVAG